MNVTLHTAKPLADEHNEVFVSAASVWEIATKVRLGKAAAKTFDLASNQRLCDDARVRRNR